MRFDGKDVVVTGGAQGIGRAVARGFAAEGAGVVILDNEADVLEATAGAIRASGAQVEEIAGDVSRREDVRNHRRARHPSRRARQVRPLGFDGDPHQHGGRS